MEKAAGFYQNTILFGWDGVARHLVKKGLAYGYLPNLKALLSTGAFAAIDVLHTTDSKAGWAQILTGYDPEITGVFSNNNYQVIPRGYTVFERLHKFYDSDNFIAAGIIGRSIEAILPPYGPVQEKNLLICCLPNDEATCFRALEFLNQHRDKQFFLFVHFEETDLAAHIFGDGSRAQFASLLATEARTGQIITKLKQLGLYENSLVYITSDHGFDIGKRTHHNAPWVFLISKDDNLRRQGEQADVAPTIMSRLGLDTDKIEPLLSGQPLLK